MLFYILKQTIRLIARMYLVILFFVLLQAIFQIITGFQGSPIFP